MKWICGIRQVTRAVENGRAKRVVIARDTDPALTEPLLAASEKANVPVEWTETRKDLGRVCGLAVGNSAAAETNDISSEGCGINIDYFSGEGGN